jgi:hypothetical protein
MTVSRAQLDETLFVAFPASARVWLSGHTGGRPDRILLNFETVRGGVLSFYSRRSFKTVSSDLTCCN